MTENVLVKELTKALAKEIMNNLRADTSYRVVHAFLKQVAKEEE